MTDIFISDDIVVIDNPSHGEFSPSQLDTYRRCPQAWEFTYIDNLKHKGRKKYFDKGNYIHELMHVYNQLLQQGYAPGSDLVVAALRSRIAQDIQLATTDNVDIYNTVSKLMAVFTTQISPLIDAGNEILAIEVVLRVPAKTPGGRDIFIIGIVDLVYRTPQGEIVIRDHKSSDSANAWNPEKVRASHQLLTYGAQWMMLTGEVPVRVEVNFINSHEYVKQKPPKEMFDLIPFEHTAKAYQLFWESTLRRIDIMLDSPIEPLYSADCPRCAFWPVCKLRIRGIDTTHIIKNFYEVVERDYTIRRKSDLSTDDSRNNPAFIIDFSSFGKRG